MKQKAYLGIIVLIVFLSVLPLAGLSFYDHPAALRLTSGSKKKFFP